MSECVIDLQQQGRPALLFGKLYHWEYEPISTIALPGATDQPRHRLCLLPGADEDRLREIGLALRDGKAVPLAVADLLARAEKAGIGVG